MAQTPLQFPLLLDLFHTCCQRVTVWLSRLTPSLVRERLNTWVAMVFMLLCRSMNAKPFLKPLYKTYQRADRVTNGRTCLPTKITTCPLTIRMTYCLFFENTCKRWVFVQGQQSIRFNKDTFLN
jgi:hypothetical protein